MSDEEDQEIPKEEPKEEPGKKFFVSHMNSYTGKALLKELRNETLVKDPMAAHTFYGTLRAEETDYKGEVNPEGVLGLVKVERTREFRDMILQSDVIIYDLLTNKFEEVDYVIKTLKTSELQSQKTLILLSSVMTWVNTPPKIQVEGQEVDENAEQEEPEEEEAEGDGGEPEPEELDANGEPIPKKKVLFFKESDYHLRVPHESFQYLKTLETQAMSAVKTQPKLTVNVLCSGIRYGNGEDNFYELFKMAWLQSPVDLYYAGQKPDNLIPTIHVIDLSRLVRRIVNDKIQKQYIFAIDRTIKPTQKRIIESISRGIGTSKIGPDGWGYLTNFNVEFLKINLKMRASDAFKDGEPPEDAEDPEEAAKKLKFPWHCEKGVVDNIRLLNVEFNDFRGLHPVKIFISGPPASGKTTYSDTLAAYYNIPRVHVKELVNRALEMAKVEEGGSELHEEIKAKQEELKDAMVAQIEESRPEDAEPEEIDREKLVARFPDEILFKLLKIRLTENDCRNRGYILDGYPRCYKHAQEIFLIKPKKFVDGEEVEEDEPELEEGEEKSYDAYIPNAEIFPSSVIVLQADDDFLINRVKELPQSSIEGTHYTFQDMARRLKSYRIANNSQIAEPSIEQFFKQQAVQTFEQSCTTPQDKAIDSFKIYIERFEKPFNYQTWDQTTEQTKRWDITGKRSDKAYQDILKIQREDGVEKEIRKQKEAYTKQRLDQIKETERDLLDTKSQPIRQYLMDNLVPILTEGLIEVCKRTPADPVDFLAEYLFKRSLDVPYPDPTSY